MFQINEQDKLIEPNNTGIGTFDFPNRQLKLSIVNILTEIKRVMKE
jgi:hypothetical protein